MAIIAKELRNALQANQSSTVIDGDEPTSASRLWSLTDRFAGGLRSRDVARGDAVGIHLGSPTEFLVAVYGTLRNGSVPVVVPGDYDADTTAAALEAAGASVLVTDVRTPLYLLSTVEPLRLLVTHDVDVATLGSDFEEVLEGGGLNPAGTRSGIDVFRQPEDSHGLVAYVDTRAGDPLGITYSHGAIRRAVETGVDVPDDGDVERHLGAYPLDHPIGLLYGATATILDGGCYVPLTEWDPQDARARLYADGIDRTYVTPRQYGDLKADAVPPGDAVCVVDPVQTAAQATGDDVRRLCGTPETGLTHLRSPDDVAAGRLGTPLGGVETTVLDGELAIRSDAAMDGYVDAETLTDEKVDVIGGDPWIRTGAPAALEDGSISLNSVSPTP